MPYSLQRTCDTTRKREAAVIRTWIGFTHAFYKTFKVKWDLALNWFMIFGMLADLKDYAIGSLYDHMGRSPLKIDPETVSRLLRSLIHDKDLELVYIYDGDTKKNLDDFKSPRNTSKWLEFPPSHTWKWSEKFDPLLEAYAREMLNMKLGNLESAHICAQNSLPFRLSKLFYKVVKLNFPSEWQSLLMNLGLLAGSQRNNRVEPLIYTNKLSSTEAYIVIHVLWLSYLEGNSNISRGDLMDQIRQIRNYVPDKIQKAIDELILGGFVNNVSGRNTPNDSQFARLQFNPLFDQAMTIYTSKIETMIAQIWRRFDKVIFEKR